MTPALDINYIRKTLRDWGSLKDLADSPLVYLKTVEARHQSAGYSDSPGGHGLALRDVLEKAIEDLRPNEANPDLLEKRWRPYIILNMQYLEGRSPEYIQEQLHISHGTYFAEQNRAFSLLADKLQKSEELLIHPEIPVGQSAIHLKDSPFMAPPYPAFPFIGRSSYLADIKKSLLNPNGAAALALKGLPGVGKTRLLLELAYDVDIRARYPDGILWAGLGRSPDLLALLGSWAAALNIPTDVIAASAGPSDRLQLLHTAIGQKRLLLIIDDAWQSEAALSFKLGGPNCAYLLTTRLPDVAADFACDHVFSIHEMDTDDSLALLDYFSPGLISTDLEQARWLVSSVGNLPLALILMGRYLQKQDQKLQPRRLLDALKTLKTSEHRLALSQAVSALELNPSFPLGTPLSLQAVIGLSDSVLDPAGHQALMAFSVFPPKPVSFSEEAALAVSNVPVQVLDTLVDVGLVECLPPDRYTLHQTISDYARLQNDTPQAILRFINYYADFATRYSRNFDKLDSEINNLLAACQAADQQNQPELFIKLINAIYNYLETRGMYKICQDLLTRALETAIHLEDNDNLATALFNIGDLGIRSGNFPHARQYLERSISICRAENNHELEAENLVNLGVTCMYSGQWRDGFRQLKEALQKDREWGYIHKEGWALSLLGYACMELGLFQEGFNYLDQAFVISRQTGDRRVEGFTHFNRSEIDLYMGNYASARQNADICESHYKFLGDLRGLTWLTYTYARLERQTGNYAAAQRLYEEAHLAFNNLGDGMGLAFSIHNLGRIYAEFGQVDSALAHYDEAQFIFEKIGCFTGISQCYYSRGLLYRQQNNRPEAFQWLTKALELRQQIGAQRGIAKALSNLALLHSQENRPEKGLALAQQAVQIVRPSQAQPCLAYVLTCLGEVCLTINDLPQARTAFKEALQILEDIGQNHLSWEPLAGLARVAVNGGLYNRASSLAADVLNRMEKQKYPAGVWLPEQIQLYCADINSSVAV
ncbi:MAG: tetratricopeptide repeat protein [Anaerolineae bacterium]|nr:tetratricopeptide repeat protein [Anaerolineae bacterium]